ncbi:hypothetical protein [Bdellovibrio sp. GT3]|uniref:hypothetical protein n=1 Tax=Bdellovibrio sp. GT3 TaxID=3136282 RepID=UPI0030F14DC0
MKKSLVIAATLLASQFAQATDSNVLYKCNLMVQGKNYELNYTADLADNSIQGATFYTIKPQTPVDMGDITIAQFKSSWTVDIQRVDGKKGPGANVDGSKILLSSGGSNLVLLSCEKITK